MKNIIALISLLALLVLGCNLKEQEQKQEHDPEANYFEKLDEYFTTLTQLKKFNGGVLVQKDGELILSKAYSMSSEPGSSLAVSEQSQFDIHSISKLMAQAAVVDLEKENLISREDKVSKYVADFPRGDEITIQHLIDNQSGLAREFSQAYPDLIEQDPEELIASIKQEASLFEPGTETMYSNLGYQLLYFIISKITNKPFVQHLDDTFFQPLQMTSTGAHFHLNGNKPNRLVKNHEEDDDEIVVVPNVQRSGKNQAKIYSTAEDLLKFIEYVTQEPYRAALINSNNEIGWSGGGDGILSHAKASFGGNYELVFFSNYDEIPFGDIIETVEKIMNDTPYELPRLINRKAIHVDENILGKYVGKYRMKEFNNDIFEFRLEQQQLVFYQNGERGAVLSAESETTFFDQPDAEDYFEFRLTSSNEYQLVFHYKSVEVVGKQQL